jgi:hypothetical protein
MNRMTAGRLTLTALVATAGWIGTTATGASTGEQPAGQVGPPVDAQHARVRPEDVATIDGLLTAFYESTAGPAGQPRDWDRLRSICSPVTRFVASRPMGDGRAAVFALTVEDYIQHNRTYFEKGGFFESEAARRTETFGNIAHVWSTYESRRSKDDPEPYSRGIYSFQLLYDGQAWSIVSVFWDHERPENPLPDKYLQTPEE